MPLNTLIFSALNQNNEVPKELRRISKANLRNEKVANFTKSFIINNIN